MALYLTNINLLKMQKGTKVIKQPHLYKIKTIYLNRNIFRGIPSLVSLNHI